MRAQRLQPLRTVAAHPGEQHAHHRSRATAGTRCRRTRRSRGGRSSRAAPRCSRAVRGDLNDQVIVAAGHQDGAGRGPIALARHAHVERRCCGCSHSATPTVKSSPRCCTTTIAAGSVRGSDAEHHRQRRGPPGRRADRDQARTRRAAVAGPGAGFAGSCRSNARSTRSSAAAPRRRVGEHGVRAARRRRGRRGRWPRTRAPDRPGRSRPRAPRCAVSLTSRRVAPARPPRAGPTFTSTRSGTSLAALPAQFVVAAGDPRHLVLAAEQDRRFSVSAAARRRRRCRSSRPRLADQIDDGLHQRLVVEAALGAGSRRRRPRGRGARSSSLPDSTMTGVADVAARWRKVWTSASPSASGITRSCRMSVGPHTIRGGQRLGPALAAVQLEGGFAVEQPRERQADEALIVDEENRRPRARRRRRRSGLGRGDHDCHS